MAKTLKAPVARDHIVKKHVSVIHIGARLTLLQRKLVNALLYNAYDELLTDKKHRISASLLCEMIGFDSKNIAYLKQALRGLTETSVEFDLNHDDGEEAWTVSTLIASASLSRGVCTYEYSTALAEKLHHPSIYSKISLSILREMNSSHALVLYENCHRFIGNGRTALWDLDTFRKIMAIEGRYREFKFLKRDVILPAMKEVNAFSNIHVELETLRKGRSVTGIQFTVKPNRQLAMLDMNELDDVTTTASYLALRKAGVSKTLARAWALEHDEAYILDKLDLATRQDSAGRIKSSKVGFLKSAIEDDYHNEASQKQAQKEVVKQARDQKQEREAQISKLTEARKKAEIAYRAQCTDMMQTAFEALPKTKQTHLAKAFEESLNLKPFVDAYREGGWGDRRIHDRARTFWSNEGLSFPTPEQWSKASGEKNPEAVQAQISALKNESA